MSTNERSECTHAARCATEPALVSKPEKSGGAGVLKRGREVLCAAAADRIKHEAHFSVVLVASAGRMLPCALRTRAPPHRGKPPVLIVVVRSSDCPRRQCE